MVILTGMLPSSCSKAKVPAAQARAPIANLAASSGSSTNKNLGELELTNHYETCVILGAGKSCTIRPIRIDRSNLQLTMALESKNTDGQVNGLSVVQIVTKSGQPFEVAVGDLNLKLTPRLNGE